VSDPIKLTVEESFLTPSERPVLGEKRLVRMIPVPIAGTKQLILRPAIWISPYSFYDEDAKAQVKVAVLLFDPGPPRPETVGVRVPADAIDKFPLGPIEW
jgi:hypothetical protein